MISFEGSQTFNYNFDDRGSLSLYEFLYQKIRDDIVSGVFGAGDRLPSKRSCAAHLGIGRITVETAYDQLVAEGYVFAKPRSGYFVCNLPDSAAVHAFPHNEKRVQTPLSASLLSRCVGREDPSADKPPRSSTSQDCPFDLTGSRNTSTTDAVHLWKRALRHVLSTEPEAEVFAPLSCPGKSAPAPSNCGVSACNAWYGS